MKYVIHAYDAQDAQAPNRRMAARPAHLEGVKTLKANNQYVLGGALLNADGQMIGSMMVVEFETEESMQNWYKNDPYVVQNVWSNVNINTFRPAPV